MSKPRGFTNVAVHSSVAVEVVTFAVDRCRWSFAKRAGVDVSAEPSLPWVAIPSFVEVSATLLGWSHECAVAAGRYPSG